MGGSHICVMADMLLKPDPEDARLTRRVRGIDQEGKAIDTAVVVERPLTLFLNGQEVVTMMTIGAIRTVWAAIIASGVNRSPSTPNGPLRDSSR